MKVFVFEGLKKVSTSYHEGGGAIVIAKDRDHVLEITKNSTVIIEWDKLTFEYDLKGKVDPKVIVFPDAGCC